MRDQQRQISGVNVQCAMNDPFGALAYDRDGLLLSNAAVAVVQRRCLGDDDFIEHQRNRSFALEKPAFQPPFAWRQVVGRKDRVYRGRFQLTRSRRIARRTLCNEV